MFSLKIVNCILHLFFLFSKMTEGYGCFSLFDDVPCLQNSPVQLFIWLFSVCLMVWFGDPEPSDHFGSITGMDFFGL